jgi:hypothetical protein
MQKQLKLEGVDMSLSGIRKGLKKRGFNAKRKIKTNFVSKDNKAKRYAWAKKYRNYTLTDWRQWAISDTMRPEPICGALMAILSFGRMVTILCCLIKWSLTFKDIMEGLCSEAV